MNKMFTDRELQWPALCRPPGILRRREQWQRGYPTCRRSPDLQQLPRKSRRTVKTRGLVLIVFIAAEEILDCCVQRTCGPAGRLQRRIV